MRIAVAVALGVILPVLPVLPVLPGLPGLGRASIAAADPAPARDATQLVAGDCARARKAGKTCVLDLPAEEVTGESATAGDLALRILVFGTQASLIRVRHDFIPEIVKAAEDL